VPRLLEKTALAEAKRLLESWLDHPKFRHEQGPGEADLVVDQGSLRLVVEVKQSTDVASVGAAIAQARKQAARLGRRSVPVVVAPFMGDVAKRLCAEAAVSWFDLSGNASIIAPGLRILIEGKPNRYLRPGRPSSAFASKSARIARHLLIHSHRSFRQQELSRETGLDDGFTSRIVSRLEADGLVLREQGGAIRVPNPDLMLDAWADAYSFERHAIVRGHITTRGADELPARISGVLEHRKVRHAATGLAAAWLHTRFAGFRLVTFYVEEPPDEALSKQLGFREEPKGANVWLVVPNDDGVFDGASRMNNVACVHPVQAYLDLLGHPERAKEAAGELRSRLLAWKE
jgi:hypothetical protein